MSKDLKFRGLSGSALKWIAILTMLIDHIGGCFLEVYLMNGYGNSPFRGFWELPENQREFIYGLDLLLRSIGRIAFPIFCFLLVEGFVHTRNVKKYALRLGIFCLVSEVPFDLAFHGVPFFWQYQNVFFTLLLGLLGIWGLRRFEGNKLAGLACALGAALGGYLLRTDYGVFGVCFIELMYLLRGRKMLRNVLGIVCLFLYGGLEMLGALAFIPISFYNGNRGKQPKYFFYIFYPAHLLVLVGLAYLLAG